MPKFMTKKHELDWNKICENDNFTAGYTIKETNVFLSSDKRTTEQSRLIRILAISCMLALNMRCRLPESTFKVLYYTFKISDGFIFGHYFCPKLKSSEIFFQVMYY